MTEITRTVAGAVSALVLAAGIPDTAQAATQSALTLQVAGAFARGGNFTGTLTVNRFEQDDNKIVAIGFVQGTLRRGNNVIGTALAGEVAWPVHVRAGGVVLTSGTSPAVPELVRASWSTDASPRFRMIPVQAEGCTVLRISLGATNVNLLGFDVALEPVGLTLTGEAGTPLGDLVCAAADLLGNLAGIVNLLNSILGLVTGLLGGLTGGLG